MNGQQYKKLHPYEHHFNTALHCDYARNVTTKGFRVMTEVFEEIFKRPSKLGSGCGTCTLRDMKLLAQEYFKYKVKLEEKEDGNQEDGKESE